MNGIFGIFAPEYSSSEYSSPSPPSSPVEPIFQTGAGRKRNHSSSESTEAEEEIEPYHLLDSRQSSIPRFSITDRIFEFELDPLVSYPDERLREIFEKLINQAINESENITGRKMEKFKLLLFGLGLDDPVILPLRPFPQNSADVLMNSIEKLGQSDGEQCIDKRTLLLSHSMKLSITTVNPPSGAACKFNARRNFGLNYDQSILVENNDRLCLFYAFVLARRHREQKLIAEAKKNKLPIDPLWMSRFSFRRFKKNKDRIFSEVIQLLVEADIPANLNAYGIAHMPKVQDYWDKRWPGLYRFVAFEDAPELEIRPIWKGKYPKNFQIAIFLENNHWIGIKKIGPFFKLNRKYCVDCAASFDRNALHRMSCPVRCYNCSTVFNGPCKREMGIEIECQKCHRYFYNKRCYDSHMPETCRIWRKCLKCERVYQYDSKQAHECHSSYCIRCKVVHNKERGCFLKKLNKSKKKIAYRLLVFDTETTQDKELDERTQEHIVNCISLRITCSICADSNSVKESCEICGPEKIKFWSETEGDDCIADFTEWILSAFNQRYDTYIYSHNGSRFDSHFIFRYLMSTGRFPEPQMSGLKLFEFRVQNTKKNSRLIFRDSYLLMSVPLDALPETFALDAKPKPFFPYLFSRKANYNVRLDQLPPESDYCPKSMSEKKYKKFKEWYEQNKNTSFFLPEELKIYCENDTDILLKALLAFRKIFIHDVTNGLDLLSVSPTLASLCMNIFKAMFLKDSTIAIVPERGFERQDRASVLALKYLEFRSIQDEVEILHAGNGGEVTYNGFKLDGYIPTKKKAIEILGCYYHGCHKCYSPADTLVDNRLAMDLYEKTMQRIQKIRQPDANGCRLEVEEIWECEIHDECKKNDKLKEFMADLRNEKGPIDPRKAFYGGRTGPLRLLQKADKNNKISVFDIISLYSSINYATEYPVGIPNIIRPHASETKVDWKSPAEIIYKGLLKVRIIPPKGLHIPVIPLRMDERLLFPCCGKCAKNFRTCNTRQHNYKCNHTDFDRSFVTTVTHIELKHSLERGYICDRFYRAWHYEKWTNNLFSDYVRHFMRLKVEASGFPPGIISDEEKAEFVKRYKDEMNIIIRLDHVKKNPGLRYIAKICLNSLWGKFSQRNNLGKNIALREPSKFYELVYDHRIEIDNITKISEPAIRVHFKRKNDFIEEGSCSSIVISLWTTSAARLALLRFMEQVQSRRGCKILYTDTDSIIVYHPRNVEPLDTGDMLGCMQEEYNSYDIVEFCSGDAKQYGLHLSNKENGEETFLLKIRGITLDQKNCKKFHYNDFRNMVKQFGRNQPFCFKYRKIGPRRDSKIIVRDMEKKYLPVMQKGIVTENLDVLPFGFE